MTQPDPDFSHNPLADSPLTAGLFATLVALMSALGGLVAYGRTGHGREGDGLVGLPLWRETRATLRIAEGVFRRLLLAKALPLAEAMATRRAAQPPTRSPARPKQAVGASAGSPDRSEALTGTGAAPDTEAGTRAGETAASATPLPWRPVRLHETGRTARTWGGLPRPPLRDVFGTLRLPLVAEGARYCALVVAIENPEPSIQRLARILDRQRRRAEAALSGGVPDEPKPRRPAAALLSLSWSPAEGRLTDPPAGLAGALAELCSILRPGLREAGLPVARTRPLAAPEPGPGLNSGLGFGLGPELGLPPNPRLNAGQGPDSETPARPPPPPWRPQTR